MLRFPRLAESRLPRVPSESRERVSKRPAEPAKPEKIQLRQMKVDKGEKIPGRLQTQLVEELEVDAAKLPPLRFLRNCLPCFSDTETSRSTPLTMFLPIQLGRELVFRIFDAGLIQTENDLSTLLLLSSKQLYSLQLFLPTPYDVANLVAAKLPVSRLTQLVLDYAFVPCVPRFPRYHLLEEINAWLQHVFQNKQKIAKGSHPLFRRESKSSQRSPQKSRLPLKVSCDPDRIAHMNFLNAIKSLHGGAYLHSISFLDCRQWGRQWAGEKVSQMEHPNLPSLIFRKFRSRASHRNCRHNDLSYVDLSGCDLSYVDGDELVRVLRDVNCQAAVYGLPEDEILQKLPKLSIAYLSLESVTFDNKAKRVKFLRALTPLLLDSHFYFLDLAGWNREFVTSVMYTDRIKMKITFDPDLDCLSESNVK